MSPNAFEANDILREHNYFVWGFNAIMRLAKKGLLDNRDATKAPEGGDVPASTRKVNDLKAFEIVTTMISTTCSQWCAWRNRLQRHGTYSRILVTKYA